MRFYECKDGITVRKNNDLQMMFKEMEARNCQAMKIELDEGDYTSVDTACSVFRGAIKRGRWPFIIVKRGNDIYAVRTDI